jgi:hypothetical protein
MQAAHVGIDDDCVSCPDNKHVFKGLAPPLDYLPFILAERFSGTTPVDFLDMPADRRAYMIEILSVEGYINNLFDEASQGTEPGTDLWIAEVEYDLWDD